MQQDSDEEDSESSDDDPEYDSGELVVQGGVINGALSGDPPPREIRGRAISEYAAFRIVFIVRSTNVFELL